VNLLKDFKNAAWKKSVDDVLQAIREQEIKFARLQFIDVNGIPKSISVSTRNLETIFENGQSFDGSSVAGYRSIEESDMIVFQDPTTFSTIP